MIVVSKSPSGVVLEPFDQIRIQMRKTEEGINGAKVQLKATNPCGKELVAIHDSVFQPGWDGVILPAAVGVHTELTVIVTSWPAEVTGPAVWTFYVRTYEAAGD